MKQIAPPLISELLGNYARVLPEEEHAAGELIADILPKIISGERPEILWEFTASYIGMEYREKVKPTKEAKEMRRAILRNIDNGTPARYGRRDSGGTAASAGTWRMG